MTLPAWRQDRDAYPHSFEVQPRYRDEDMLHHVNNISVAVYYDEVRSRLMREIFRRAGNPPDIRIVTAETRVSYADEVFYPDLVDIRSGLIRLGTASFTIGQALFQSGRYCGFCDTVLVQAAVTGAEPIHPKLREAMQGLMIAQA
ncbi:MAG: thioesterase [Caulobacter sp.]|nr:thioesterase [Caulobacter sp.]